MHSLNPNQQFNNTHQKTKVIMDLEDEDKLVFNLECGATLFKTPIGLIQFGMPPGSLADIISKGFQIPEYFIIPTIRFHKKHAVNLADFQQIALYNYLINKKQTQLICSPFAAENLKKVFAETYPKIEQSQFHKILDFYTSIDKNPMPDFAKERRYIHQLIEEMNPDIKFDDMLKFVILDKSDKNKMELKLDEKHQVIIKIRSHEFIVMVESQEIGSVQDKIDIGYVTEVNWDDELKKKFNIDELLKLSSQIRGPRNIPIKDNLNENQFGVTFLPKVNEEQGTENSLGFIIWINGRGIIVDPPQFTSQILTKLHISSVLIEWIIITQNNTRNDQGAFQLLFENSNLELITTRQIYQQFIRKYSYLSSMSKDFLEKILKFRPVCIGATLMIKTCKFKFFYNMGIVPTIGFLAIQEKQSLYFAGDTMYDLDRLKQAHSQGVLSADRLQMLQNQNWKNCDMIIMNVGTFPWNTKLETLEKLPIMTPQLKQKMYLITREDNLYPSISDRGFKIPPQTLEGQNIIKLTDPNAKKLKTVNLEKIKQKELTQKVDLLCTIEIFENISIKNFRDLLQSAKEEYFQPGEYIIKQGTIGTKFYFVMQGIVCIFTNNRSLVRYCGTGSYFGEKALNQQRDTRGANVIAAVPTVLISLEKQDFWFIFGEERDEAGQITEKLLSIQQSRQKDTVNLMRINPILKDFSEPQRQEIEMILKQTQFDTNKIIWQKGDQAQFAVFVKSGAIKFSDCPEQNKDEMGEGYFIGEIDALLNEGPLGRLTTTLIAIKDTDAFVIDKAHLLHFFKKNLGVLLKINYFKYFGPGSDNLANY